ncbi:thioesterase II family protein [Sinorhizobium meliloti]|uniref:thioesterase II family protein n=1 Tax=Rhizobium meliloti TaxID=382 RepID=UPI000FDC3582|nr:alpha/beta fold hydrolase [Sinorhizobium meliloti]RVK17017.1 thioesterase [Sinorhizobium meliloti]
MKVGTETATHKCQEPLRLICFPPAGAGAAFFYPFKLLAPSWLSIEPVELPGRGARFGERPLRSVDALADDLCRRIRVVGDFPCAFFGHSFGALLAFAVAQRQCTRAPLALFISACPAPHHISARPKLHQLADRDLLDVLGRLNGTAWELLENEEFVALLLPILRADLEAFESCDARSMDGAKIEGIKPVLMCGTNDEEISIAEMIAWKRYFDQPVSQRPFPGDHFFILRRPSLLIASIFEELSCQSQK